MTHPCLKTYVSGHIGNQEPDSNDDVRTLIAELDERIAALELRLSDDPAKPGQREKHGIDASLASIGNRRRRGLSLQPRRRVVDAGKHNLRLSPYH